MSAVPPLPLTYQRPIDDVSVSAWRPIAKVIAILVLLGGALSTTGVVFELNTINEFYPFLATFRASASTTGSAAGLAQVRSIWTNAIITLVADLTFTVGGLSLLLNFRISRLFILIGMAWSAYQSVMSLYDDLSSPPATQMYRAEVMQMRIEGMTWSVSFLIFAVFTCIILLVPRDLFPKKRIRL